MASYNCIEIDGQENCIRTGDVIFIQGEHPIKSRAIRVSQRIKELPEDIVAFTHVAIAYSNGLFIHAHKDKASDKTGVVFITFDDLISCKDNTCTFKVFRQQGYRPQDIDVDGIKNLLKKCSEGIITNNTQLNQELDKLVNQDFHAFLTQQGDITFHQGKGYEMIRLAEKESTYYCSKFATDMLNNVRGCDFSKKEIIFPAELMDEMKKSGRWEEVTGQYKAMMASDAYQEFNAYCDTLKNVQQIIYNLLSMHNDLKQLTLSRAVLLDPKEQTAVEQELTNPAHSTLQKNWEIKA